MKSGIDWEDAFLNAPYIPDGDGFKERWTESAAAFRKSASVESDLPYGDHPRERFDLFHPDGKPKGLAIFIHGGFWLALDKSYWSNFAAGALEMGWAVAMPSYTLAPEARIGHMTRQIGQAVTEAASRISGPIRLSGHSAGGHLATRMICENGPLERVVSDRIERVVSISGLHDLRPLRLHSMNAKLQLDSAEVDTESPALQQPMGDVQSIAWVGGQERPEFLRQSSLLVEAWSLKGAQTDLVVEPDRHHFDVIDGLKSKDHPLCKAFVGD